MQDTEKTAARKPEGWVYALKLTIGGEYRWTPLDTSLEGTNGRLVEIIDAYGVRGG